VGRHAETEVQAEARGTGSVSTPKRERILTGMLEEVGSAGYDATSVRTVLDRTGLYRQAFYDSFADKDDCYRCAYDAGAARVEALAADAAAGEEGWRAKLRTGLSAILDFLDSEPDVGRALLVEVHAAGPELLARRAEAMKRAADFIDLARLDPDVSEAPPPITSEGVVAGIHAVVHSRLSTGADAGFRELLPEFMYVAVLLYFGADAATAEMQAARV
jgi:AcrR family transcriptional regulator